MDFVTILGLCAGALTTIANIPQLIKSWKTKSTHDLALGWIAIMWGGILLWLIYGIMLNNTPLIISNIFTFAMVSALFYLKLKYG